MEMLILKTNINSKSDFKTVKYTLNSNYKINECTVDLGDKDKVLRLVGDKLNMDDVINQVKDLGYNCEELNY